MIIYGKNSVKEFLINSPSEITEVFVFKGSKQSFYSEIEKLCKKNKLKLTSLSDSEISKLCKTTKHQGIAANIKEFEYTDLGEFIQSLEVDESDNLVVALDHIEDPHNLGAIIRSVNVLGADAVIIARDRSCGVTPSVVKASSGAVNYVPIIQEVNLSRTLEKLKNSGFWVAGADQGAEKNIYEEDFSGRSIALVMGSEGRGLGSNLKKQCDYLVKIPQAGQITSLNVSVAAGILIYELIYKTRCK
ncbi:MAG: 23S rRNA (guanosine(2251)-2'-O)-methyltransferase RlmB [Candidatus Dadabacteria bacterium]|nr:23S rRNA (guanosine(2251)-2'-O)-methyltransferase RlmB [Candidatus Dadabacteria bacterium]NIS10201.1 23S rRNA (guanosine(2251)-2'-O)-methyltransferase RlmB [Candidatus Dadabacteria bacterium]NIV42636.1 23S rRNA (guanosine(2251)-2'-O)-methyltransferase RlmB [Candidatus Dadabacteria bacterium]NIX16567.1 23S rRNA (guanosine(2251)-2'-O)-methyltransferase RlmB [Candidatus Dadabacteria bacterium]NIY23116.1 23S rRNA (guanosine(2251)-2'-O)-methyltransferase RlmB [Candidatus Dadabacteria bacterium]